VTSFKNRAAAIQKAQRRALLTCPRGCGRGKPGHNYCTDCGTALPVAVQKSRAPQPAATWNKYAADPVERELAFQATYGAFLKRAQG
jgi:hypothetical protein